MVSNILLLHLIHIIILIFIKAYLVIYLDIRVGDICLLEWIVCDFELLRFFRYPTVVKLILPIVFLLGVAFLFLRQLLLGRHCDSDWFGGCHGASVSRDIVAVV